MSGKVKVAAAHPPLWHGLNFCLGASQALQVVEKNIAEVLRLADAAAEEGCIVVAYPEDTLGMMGWQSHHIDDQEPLVVPATEMLTDAVAKKAAERGLYIIVCTDLFEPDGLYNTAILFGPDGGEIGRYHKVNLPLSEQMKKRGDRFPVFDTPELGGVGVCICYDMVFPETVRALALAGADVVFHLTMGGAACPGGAASDAAFIARAADNEVYIVVSWRGNSRIIAPSGDVLAEAEEGKDLTIAEIDPFGGREFGDACAGTWPDHRARLFRERVPGAYAILPDPEPPILEKDKDVTHPTPDEAAHLGAEVLTTGQERFTAADKLVAEGKTAEAIDEFEAMSDHFKTTWIGRSSRERLKTLRKDSP